MSSSNPGRKPVKAQPKNVARRSQAERDALERAEAERKRARAEAAAADAAAEASRRRAEYGLPTNDHRQNKWRGRDGHRSSRGGRGGFMGHGMASVHSPPSQPQPTSPRISNRGSHALSSVHHEGPFMSNMRSSSSVVKREPVIKQSGDEDIAMLGIPNVKKDPEELGYLSSDIGEAEVGHQVNVDYINLIHDDEPQESGSRASRIANLHPVGSTVAQRHRRFGGGEPVRLQRKEHTDRAIKLNTEASSATAAVLRRKPEDTSTLDRLGSFDEGAALLTKKSKVRARDVEVVGDRRRWRGVWDDDSDVQNVKIKEEPRDECLVLEVEPDLADLTSRTVEGSVEANVPQALNRKLSEPPENEAKAHIRYKLKHSVRDRTRPSMYQTAEELREWSKRQEELATIQQELGRIHISENGRLPENLSSEEGDVVDKRQDAVYLFQLPAILPDLCESTIKKEPSSPPIVRNAKLASPTVHPSAKDIPTKIEDDDFGGNLDIKQARPTLAPGRAGRLRVHESGRTLLSWGGTDMEMKMGVSPYFLQTAVLTKMHKHGEQGASNTTSEGSGGQAISFGQIRGKLVVLPAWTDILGERGLA